MLRMLWEAQRFHKKRINVTLSTAGVYALASTPFITTSVLDLDRDDSELESAAVNVEHMAAALLLSDWGLAGLNSQSGTYFK